MSQLSAVKTDCYDAKQIDDAVACHFERLAVASDLHPGMKILIKPNLLSAKRPEQAVTTHPALILSIVKWLKAHGIEHITIADSPGGPYIASALKAIYSTCGLKVPALEEHLNYDTSWQLVPCREGLPVRSFNLITPVCQADYIINVAKLKTHAMTTLSAGIKNLFGTIPGLQKPEMHYRFPLIEDFSSMLLALAQTVKPQFTILDAVDAMEGNGPSGGTPRHMGLTLASRDVFSQDYYAASLMGIAPLSVPMLQLAKEQGLIRPDEIQVMGDSVLQASPPFALPDAKSLNFMGYVPAFLKKPAFSLADRVLRPVPKVDKKKCIGCGKCAESCPPGVIAFQNKKAVPKRKGCISCFCCQEMCPVHAIEVKRMIKF